MSLLFAALPSLVDLTKTPKLSIRVTINEQIQSAGRPLTGQIWINPSSSSSSNSNRSKASKSSKTPTAVVSSIIISARCVTRSDWQDDNGVRRYGEAVVYQLEKQLLPPVSATSTTSSDTEDDNDSIASSLSSSSDHKSGIQPLPITGPKVLDFKILLPRAAQRTATAWNPSNRFAFRAGHDIPPSITGVVEHVLVVEVLTRQGGLFRSPRQVIELPYSFVASRSEPNLQPPMRGVFEKPVGRPPRQAGAGGSRRNRGREVDAGGEYLVGANLPSRVYIGGELPIELGVRRLPRNERGTHGVETRVDAVLRTLSVNIVSYSVCRVKLAENTGGLDPEAGRQESVRHRLKDARDLALPIGQRTRIDACIEGIRALAPAGVPTFRTYNAARSYKIEFWICISIGSKSYDLAWSADIHIESGYYRPPIEPPRSPTPTRATNPEVAESRDNDYDEDMFLPPYTGPPPEYNDNADNRISLTTQALRQGVDIIDLL